MDSLLPGDLTESDPHFDMPSVGDGVDGGRKTLKVTAPTTTMVYCVECQRHWEAPAEEKWWNARVELCPEHSRKVEAA